MAAVGLMRLRGALVGLMAIVLAVMAGRIFDEYQSVLLLAAGVPAVALLVVLGRSWVVQVVTAILAVAASVVAVVALAGGELPGDVVDASTSGLRRLLSTEWPSPDRPELVGAVAGVLAIATALGMLLAGRRRWHLLVLVPSIAVFIGIVAASAPAGAATWWLAVLAPLGAAVAALRIDRDVGETLRILAGDRQLVPLAVVAAVLAAAISLPLTLDDRADPRGEIAASSTEPIIDPIEAVVALRAIEPPRTLYAVDSTDDAIALPTRWRTAVLDRYDGQRWTPDAVLGTIGRRLGPDLDDDLDLRMVIGTDGTTEVPLPGPPVTIDADVQTDPDRTIVRLLEPAEAGETIEMRAGVDPGRAEIGTDQVGTRPVDEIAATFTNIAEGMAGEGTILERLTTIESTLAAGEYALDRSAPGAGMQQALIERFLTETHRGTDEQFVAAFVLLARSLGVDARIATGFDTSAEPDGAEGVLRTQDALAWPEVAIDGLGWVAFDPVPSDEATEPTEEQSPPREQAPAAAPPPVASQNEPEVSPEDEDQASDDTTDGGWSTAVVVAVGTGLALGIVLVPVLLVVGVILGLKHRRRRRRLHVPGTATRIRGAWAVATDSLVDAGLRIPPSSTDHEIVVAGAPLTGGAVAELERLGTMSSAATYATADPPSTVADDAVAALEQVETSMSASRTRWQRLRWRLSLRSLRPSTRSPVLGAEDRSPHH